MAVFRKTARTSSDIVRLAALTMILVVSLAPFFGDRVLAQESATVTLSASPESLTFFPGERSEVFLTLTNSGDEALSNLQLLVEAADNIDVEVDDADSIDTLAANSSHVWRVFVTLREAILSSGGIGIRVSFDSGPADAVKNTVLTRQISVQPADFADISEKVVISVTLGSSEQAIDTERSGWVFLTVKNDLDVPVELVSVVCVPVAEIAEQCESPQWPPNGRTLTDGEAASTACGSLPEPASSIIIAPTSSHTSYFCIEAAQQLRPGKHTIAFDVSYILPTAGEPTAVTRTISQEITFSVYGSEVLAYIGIPTIMVMPGILGYLTGLISWYALNRKPVSELSIPEQAKSPLFWIIAVTASFLTLFIYRSATATLSSWSVLFKPRENIEFGYGYLDILYLWFGAIFGGLVIAVAAWAIRGLYRRIQRWRTDRRTIEASDEPLAIIAKLANANGSLVFEEVTYDASDATKRALVLKRWKESDGTEVALIAPQIELSWNDQSTAAGDYRRSLIAQLDQKVPTAKSVLNLLNARTPADDAGVTAPRSRLSWAEAKGLSAPQTRKVEELNVIGKRRLIRLEP